MRWLYARNLAQAVGEAELSHHESVMNVVLDVRTRRQGLMMLGNLNTVSAMGSTTLTG